MCVDLLCKTHWNGNVLKCNCLMQAVASCLVHFGPFSCGVCVIFWRRSKQNIENPPQLHKHMKGYCAQHRLCGAPPWLDQGHPGLLGGELRCAKLQSFYVCVDVFVSLGSHAFGIDDFLWWSFHSLIHPFITFWNATIENIFTHPHAHNPYTTPPQLSGEFPYPIIADDKRELAESLGMLDPDELDKSGMPVTARAVRNEWSRWVHERVCLPKMVHNRYFPFFYIHENKTQASKNNSNNNKMQQHQQHQQTTWTTKIHEWM